MRIPSLKKVPEEHSPTTPEHVFVAGADLCNEATREMCWPHLRTGYWLVATTASIFFFWCWSLSPTCIWPKYRDKNRNYNYRMRASFAIIHARALNNLIYYPPPACLLLWLEMIDVHPDNYRTSQCPVPRTHSHSTNNSKSIGKKSASHLLCSFPRLERDHWCRHQMQQLAVLKRKWRLKTNRACWLRFAADPPVK